MEMLGQILSGIGGLGILICFVVMVITMFQRGATGIAILCCVLFFCCGGGILIAFIYGWVKHREWGITNLMMIWSAFIGIWFVGGVLVGPNAYQAQFQRFRP